MVAQLLCVCSTSWAQFVSQIAKLAVPWWQKFCSAWIRYAASCRHIRIPCCCNLGHSLQSIRRCIVLKYLMQGVRPCCTHSIVCCIFFFEVTLKWSWWSCGRWSGQSHSIPVSVMC